MYMGVIPNWFRFFGISTCAPHVYGGDPHSRQALSPQDAVLPMYMGVIPLDDAGTQGQRGAPHVYGGDPASLCSFWY